MTREEKVMLVAQNVAQGGWSSIHSLADKLSDDELEEYSFYWDDEFEEDEEEDEDE